MVQHINLNRTDTFASSGVLYWGDEGFFVGNVIFAIITRILCENHLKRKQQIADF